MLIIDVLIALLNAFAPLPSTASALVWTFVLLLALAAVLAKIAPLLPEEHRQVSFVWPVLVAAACFHPIKDWVVTLREPHLTASLVRQNPDRSVVIAVRNDGGSSAVIRYALACDSDQWSVATPSGWENNPRLNPRRQPWKGEVTLLGTRSSNRLSLMCDASWASTLRPVAGDTRIAPGDEHEITFDPYPARWLIYTPRAYQLGAGNSFCPIEVVGADSRVRTLIAPLCTRVYVMREP